MLYILLCLKGCLLFSFIKSFLLKTQFGMCCLKTFEKHLDNLLELS